MRPWHDRNPEMGCRQTALQQGFSGQHWRLPSIPNEDLIEYAMNDLRNKAAELGATHVQADPPQLGSGDGTTTTATVTGTAVRMARCAHGRRSPPPFGS